MTTLQNKKYPCCGALTWVKHQANVEAGKCTGPAITGDDRFVVDGESHFAQGHLAQSRVAATVKAACGAVFARATVKIGPPEFVPAETSCRACFDAWASA
jgi:hypothetical protein